MPNRDYYLREGAQYDRYRAAYRDYVVTLQRLAGIADPEAKADAIIALERRIAEAHWTPERSRDVRQVYNPMNRAQLATLAPQFNWTAILRQLGPRRGADGHRRRDHRDRRRGRDARRGAAADLEGLDGLPLPQRATPNFCRAPSTRPISISSPAPCAAQERSATAGSAASACSNNTLGEAVGEIYVERHFPAESRRQMTELIGNLRAAFERAAAAARLDGRARPGPQALAKLATFDPRIGNPDRFIDYSSIRVDRADLLGNVMRAGEFDWNLQVSRLAGPVDRALWAMTPQTINAYYSPLIQPDHLPGRRSCSRPTSIPMRIRRSITARSAR